MTTLVVGVQFQIHDGRTIAGYVLTPTGATQPKACWSDSPLAFLEQDSLLDVTSKVGVYAAGYFKGRGTRSCRRKCCATLVWATQM